MQGYILVMLSYATSLIKCLFVAHWCKHRFARTFTLSRLSAIGFTKIVFQQNHFSRSYSRRMIILGTIPYTLLPKVVFWRRCHRQMQERYKVARVKTDSQFGRTSYLRPKGDKSSEMFGEHSKLDRRERGSKKGSKNIEIYLVRRTAKAGRKISGQTGVAMFTSATYVWTFIWRCLNEMWHQHQIHPWIDNKLTMNWRKLS